MNLVKAGEKFVIIQDFPTYAMTTWYKPYTGTEDCIIPKGTVLIAKQNQLEGLPGFSLVPEKYKELEQVVITKETLADKDYGDYYFVFNKKHYGKYFVYLGEQG